MKISKACECGMWIEGTTEKQANHNMKLHRQGNRHKKQIKMQKE